MKRKQETATEHFRKQLETLHNLTWEMDCYHVNELNRMNEQKINWADCGSLEHIIELMENAVRFAKRTEE